MEFNSKPATSIEQSKKLLALGLKRETADCHYVNTSYTKEPKWELYFGVPNELFVKETPNRYIPAWSLHRLIKMIQDVCSRVVMVHSWVRIENRCTPYVNYPCDSFNNTYDNLISCIEWLIKEGYFNKEHLKNGNK